MRNFLVRGRVPAASTDRPGQDGWREVTPIRCWLDVPYAEKDAAKAAGARWDGDAKRWYAPRPGVRGLDRWVARPPLPVLLPGEDREFGSGLFVDLIPQSCFWTSARTGIAPADWDRTRHMVYGRAANRCEACGRTQAAGARLEAHERWAYDDSRGVQSLRRLICPCSDCHQVSHMGLAQVQGHGEKALGHLMRVTGAGRALAEAHVDEAFAVWAERSARTWDLDLSILEGAGIELAQSVSPARRAEIAAERLAAGR